MCLAVTVVVVGGAEEWTRRGEGGKEGKVSKWCPGGWEEGGPGQGRGGGGGGRGEGEGEGGTEEGEEGKEQQEG